MTDDERRAQLRRRPAEIDQKIAEADDLMTGCTLTPTDLARGIEVIKSQQESLAEVEAKLNPARNP